MRGRVELPSLDRQSRIMTVIWTHLNLWKFRYHTSSLTTVRHCCRLFWWMRLDLNQQCHYDGRFTVSWGYQFSYTSKNMVEHSGVEPLLVDWKPTVLTDRRMLHYMKTPCSSAGSRQFDCSARCLHIVLRTDSEYTIIKFLTNTQSSLDQLSLFLTSL